MPLGSINYYLLLMVSGFALLMQTVVKNHYHQQGSYHDSRSSLHTSTSSLALESPELFADIVPNNSILTYFSVFVIDLTLIPMGMTTSTRHDPSASRAPPRGI